MPFKSQGQRRKFARLLVEGRFRIRPLNGGTAKQEEGSCLNMSARRREVARRRLQSASEGALRNQDADGSLAQGSDSTTVSAESSRSSAPVPALRSINASPQLESSRRPQLVLRCGTHPHPESVVREDFEPMGVVGRSRPWSVELRHHRVDTAGVVTQHSPECAVGVRRRVGPEDQTVGCRITLQAVQHDTSLDTCDLALRINVAVAIGARPRSLPHRQRQDRLPWRGVRLPRSAGSSSSCAPRIVRELRDRLVRASTDCRAVRDRRVDLSVVRRSRCLRGSDRVGRTRSYSPR